MRNRTTLRKHPFIEVVSRHTFRTRSVLYQRLISLALYHLCYVRLLVSDFDGSVLLVGKTVCTTTHQNLFDPALNVVCSLGDDLTHELQPYDVPPSGGCLGNVVRGVVLTHLSHGRTLGPASQQEASSYIVFMLLCYGSLVSCGGTSHKKNAPH